MKKDKINASFGMTGKSYQTLLSKINCLCFALLVSCSPQLTTKCGAYIDGDGWLSLSDLQTTEDRILQYGYMVDDYHISDASVACTRLDGLWVKPMEYQTWIDEWGRRVYGLNFPCGSPITCSPGVVAVGMPPDGGTWRDTALAHEMCHYLQWDQPGAPDSHYNWLDAGVYAFIDKVNSN
jgi:hypothetical protein